MSSTRKAKDDSVFHQSRYASAPQFERGLVAYLVARRCALVDDKADRELIWFIQYLSHQEGGLAAIAKDLIAKYADRIQTRQMVEMKLKPGKICNADQVRKLRSEFGCQFILKGEQRDYLNGGFYIIDENESDDCFDNSDISESEKQRASKHPNCYPATAFFEACLECASDRLENELKEICLDPSHSLENGPWYFPTLIETLHDYKTEFVKARSAGVVTTALGEKVSEVLDYTAYSRGLTLMQGDARLGKSFAARQWCAQHPGNSRFVEVPDGNDDASFFRDIARALGLGNFLNYKVVQIRERVEAVLLTGDILLIFDEAHRLFPQTHFRAGYPKRMVWVMTMANAGVPICMISTPQFFATQKVLEKNGWNSAQLTGRISHYESLPADLSAEDLIAVAKSVLPEANAQVLRALAVYARSSARYLAAIDSISKRARYIATREGRDTATTDDVRKAMQGSIIPADTKLQRALESVRKGKSRMTPAAGEIPIAPEANGDTDLDEILPDFARGNLSAPGSRIRAGAEAPLIGA
jgi:hypothetical protein